MKAIFFSLLIASVTLVSFKSSEDEFCRKQGIKGHVYRVSGNQMPSPDKPASQPMGLKTTLYIYELTNTSQAQQEGVFYKNISSKLVKEIQTDEDGSFKVKLKPGRYSLFVKKDNLYYSNIFDDKNNIHPIEVRKGTWTEENFKADYDAVY